MKLGLFVEDEGHRGLVRGVSIRIAQEFALEPTVIERTATGGRGRVLESLQEYVKDLERGRDEFIDVLVIAIDSDCKAADVRKLVSRVVASFAGKVVTAIPEPHVERWFLLDPRAPAAAIGEKGVAQLPALKCEPERYKVALREAFRVLGVNPPAGGVLYGEEIANVMDLEEASRHADFRRYVVDLRGAFKLLKEEERRH